MDQKIFGHAPYTVHCIMYLVASLNAGKKKMMVSYFTNINSELASSRDLK
jgi:hypothetical protein